MRFTTLIFAFQKYFFKKIFFTSNELLLIFLNYFNVIILKIIFKK